MHPTAWVSSVNEILTISSKISIPSEQRCCCCCCCSPLKLLRPLVIVRIFRGCCKYLQGSFEVGFHAGTVIRNLHMHMEHLRDFQRFQLYSTSFMFPAYNASALVPLVKMYEEACKTGYRKRCVVGCGVSISCNGDY